MTTPTTAANRTMRIGLLWHSFFSGNLGVSALAHANMSIIAEAAKELGIEPRFVLFGPKGDRAFPEPTEFGPLEYVEASAIKEALKYRRMLADCELVFDIGSGDSFADIYGWRRFAKIGGLKFLVPNGRKKLVMSPQTLGPFDDTAMRAIAKRAMASCHKVFARDEPSLLRAQEMLGEAASSHLALATDVAFAMKPLAEEPADWPVRDAGKTHAGLNVSGLLYRGGYTGGNQFGLTLNYSELIHEFLEQHAGNEDVQVWLIPHVYRLTGTAMESDLAVARELAEKYPHAKLAPLFKAAPEAKRFISSMNVMFAARMHAAIAAVSTGTACLPMSYSVKFRGLFAQLGYTHIIDLKSASGEEAKAQMEQAIADHAGLTKDAQNAADTAASKLQPYRDAITALMRERL
ncbi:polysaccharide pyruvyl transferase family protein [Qipengyuania flava]|uniref:polysaccharide pyruvyl transferase family protein n=1 Tax=Qipengyuania flava TaxID=192812 RepID=UPI001C62CE3D|nr:polysaccharide pyruvyl transferase family protein [Qipengyuania flava]QYJ06364.1 polysaccharide pyruvyl transferase family protein [Qipengyuania flava]